MLRKDCFGVTPKPTRETRALPGRYRRRACLPFDDDHRHGMMLGMTQTDPGGFHRALFSEGLGSFVKDQERLAAYFFVHVDIAPAHCFADASAECFRYRFLGREPGRKMARGKFHRHAVGDFALGKNAFHKTFAEPIERMLNPLDLDHVHANSEHAHVEFSNAARPTAHRLHAGSESAPAIAEPHSKSLRRLPACALIRCNSPLMPAFGAQRFPSPQKLRAKRWRGRC